MTIEFDDIRAAAARLSGHVLETPLLEHPLVNQMAGRRVLVKAECLQVTGENGVEDLNRVSILQWPQLT